MGLTHHDGVSLYGSGLYTGRKGSETAVFPGAPLVRFDTGTVGVSGHTAGLSTRLTSVQFAWAQHKDTTCTSGGATRVRWSGGALDILNLTTTGSANASTAIAWCAWGL